MEGLGCIYYIYCKESNKGYVGQSVYADHMVRYKHHWLKTKKTKTYLSNSMKKYGYDAFTVQSLCIVPHSRLDNMEAYWAEQLETYIWDNPGGYNMVYCGKTRKGLKHSDATKLKISSNSKALATEENNLKKSIKMKGIMKKKNKIGELYIYQIYKSSYRCSGTNIPSKSFKTLEEAIIYRDSFLKPNKNGTSS